MKRIHQSVRVGYYYVRDDAVFADFLNWLSENTDAIEQVSFFTSWFHPPMPLETAAEHCRILKDRITAVKALGLSCGLNILDTVGHHPEHLEETLVGDYPYMTNIDGDVCLGSRCMNNPRFMEEYVGPLYRLHLAAKPDFIWIDDDIRYGHLPIGYACFCDNCIAKFNQDYHYTYTRAALKQALEDDQNVSLRREWLAHQSEKITNLFRFIRKTVNEIDPSVTLGFMTGERYFEGYDFPAWADALSDGGKYEIMWRPGGGAYSDAHFADQVGKSRELGRQAAYLPSYVTSVQSELENCPYQALKKSPRATVWEAEMHLATGCNGTAWNILPNVDIGESIRVIDRHMAAIKDKTPFMTLLSDTFDRQPLVGVHSGWHPQGQAAVPGSFIGGWGGCFAWHLDEVYSLGVPECYDAAEATCFSLIGRAPLAYKKEDLLKMLSGGVYVDGGAVQTLWDMGLGEYVGFSTGAVLPNDTEEIYLEHPLNVGFVGKKRACSLIFCKGETHGLLPSPDAEIVCAGFGTHGNLVADCTMGICRNSLGGIVCAASYFPFSELSDTQKSVQMKRLFNLLSQDRLPAYVSSYDRIRLIARKTVSGNVGVILFNMNLDTCRDVTVVLRSFGDAVRFIGDDGQNAVLQTQPNEDGTVFVTLPPLAPYAVYVLLPEKETIK